MKLIPTASQTVGPFFSIGLDPLCQKFNAIHGMPANVIAISGTVVDGDGAAIPDCVLEFWSAGSFVRVSTSNEGAFHVNVEPPAGFLDVLLLMRGLLKPVYTRVYLRDLRSFADDPALRLIPKDRAASLVAIQTDAPNHFQWNIVMQGDNETVFFEW